MMDRSVVIVAEQAQNKVAPVTYELLGLAREIRQVWPCAVKLVVVGREPQKPAQEMARRTGETVLAVKTPHAEHYSAEIYQSVLTEALPRLTPRFILIPQTPQGLDFGPGLAARLHAGCITGVSAFCGDKDGGCFSRAAYAGKISMDVAPVTPTTVLLVQPGAFQAPESRDLPSNPIQTYESDATCGRTRPLGIKHRDQEDAGLQEAEVIVAAGRGVGSPENLDLVRQLAALFPKSAVAGSRPVCDAGWLEYPRQVGLTGATVRPRLYVACGISGAYPHRVGMQGSGFIVAISTDPGAPIFRTADVCIQEDLHAFIPVLIREWEKQKA